LKSNVIELMVFDMQGRIMDHKTLNGDDLSSRTFGQNYKPGTYILKLNNAGSVSQHRVSKVD
jgi:hypothetical protein